MKLGGKVKLFDSRSLVEQSRINKALAERGLGQLHEEGLLDQIGMIVRNHEHFRKILMKLEPVQRQNCYNSIAPRLRFKAWPLEQYEAEGKAIASASASRVEPVMVGEQTACTCRCNQRSIAKKQLAGETVRASARIDIVCPCCDGHECPEHFPKPEIEQAAEFAIGLQLARENARGRMTIICHRCRESVELYAASKVDAYETLAAMGWKFDGDRAWCAGCAKPLHQNG